MYPRAFLFANEVVFERLFDGGELEERPVVGLNRSRGIVCVFDVGEATAAAPAESENEGPLRTARINLGRWQIVPRAVGHTAAALVLGIGTAGGVAASLDGPAEETEVEVVQETYGNADQASSTDSDALISRFEPTEKDSYEQAGSTFDSV